MQLVTLDEAKTHLRIDLSDASYDDDVVLKMQLGQAAVLNHLSKTVEDFEIDTSPLTYDVPLVIKAAVLLTMAEFFTNRESSVSNVLSQGVRDLLAMHYRRGWS